MFFYYLCVTVTPIILLLFSLGVLVIQLFRSFQIVSAEPYRPGLHSFPSYHCMNTCVYFGQRDGVLVEKSCLTLYDCGLQPASLLCPWDFPSMNTGVGCQFLLQEIFRPKDQTHISCVSCFAGRFFTTGPPGQPLFGNRCQQNHLISHSTGNKCHTYIGTQRNVQRE